MNSFRTGPTPLALLFLVFLQIALGFRIWCGRLSRGLQWELCSNGAENHRSRRQAELPLIPLLTHLSSESPHAELSGVACRPGAGTFWEQNSRDVCRQHLHPVYAPLPLLEDTDMDGVTSGMDRLWAVEMGSLTC